MLIGNFARGRIQIEPGGTIFSLNRFIGRRFDDPNVQKAAARAGYEVTAGPDGSVRVTMSGREYSPIEISAMILRKLKETAEDRTKEPFTRAVITVPAYFGERQVAATRDAGEMAGFHVLKTINEPTAAALAFGLNRGGEDEGKTILVCDLGGGTFDISVMMLVQGAFTVLNIEGDNFLGGDDFDSIVMESIFDEIRRQHDVVFDRATGETQALTAISAVRQEAENVKIRLSSELSGEINLPALGSAGVSLQSDLSRSDFEAMIRPRIEDTVRLTKTAIRDAGLTPSNVDHILLVGGSTLIPLVRQRLEEEFGSEKIQLDLNPMHCVALGAAIQSALLAEVDCPSCHALIPAQNDACSLCHAPLAGEPKTQCPTCHVLRSSGETNCGKCGGSASQPAASAQVPDRAVTSQSVVRRCPECGKSFGPSAIYCDRCEIPLVDQGGLLCPHCQKTNAPGVDACTFCGREMSVSNPLEMMRGCHKPRVRACWS